MRRKERQVEDIETIKNIVEDCHVVRIAMHDGKYPYIVPVNFAYTWESQRLTLYIHGARQGKKVSCIKKNPYVAVEMDCNHKLIETGRTAEEYSYAYQSLIGYGSAVIVESFEEKLEALESLMKHETGHNDYDPIPERVIKATGIIKISLDTYDCKENIHPDQKKDKT